MSDPRTILAERFSAAIRRAFGAEHADTDPLIRPAQQAKFGDYQANVAMGLGKRLGKPPREVATTLLQHAALDDLCAPPEIAGPGFINIRLRDEWLGEATAAVARHARLGIDPPATRERIVVDYSAPNVAKEMHVGHLRSTVIGDALVRTLELLGHEVVRQNHIGDWGTQFGILIEHLLETGATGDPNALYREAQARFESDQPFAERARRRVVALQAGDPETLATWRRLVEESASVFDAVYRRLGVKLGRDDIRGESTYNQALPDVVAELEAKGLARVSEGALCVFPPGFVREDGEPLPLIVRKSDGGYLYATTDLAALRYRVRELGARRLIYVTDSRQQQHFAMVFAVARLAGWLGDDVRVDHVSFGTVLGEDGKPFKTRSGDTVRLVDLLEEAEQRAGAVVAEKNPELTEGERAEVARAVGIGAIKYADLSNDRVKDYVFSWDRMLAMDGNTGPYLQYAFTRIRSIFRKAGGEPPFDRAPVLQHAAERALALQLLQLPSVVRAVADTSEPHRLCGYLYDVATAFSAFYEACPVLRAEDDAVRRERLGLCSLTARTLREGLGVLGIQTLERM